MDMTTTWARVLAAVVLCSVSSGVYQHHEASENCFFDADLDYDCRNKSLTSVPQGIPSNTTVLYLDTNLLLVLGDKELLDKGGANIQELYSSFNDIATLADEAFSGLDDLKDVYLWGNNITVFSKDIFASNLKMRSLSLGANPLTLPDSETEPLLTSASLKALTLANCYLTRVTQDLFSELPNLRKLNLEDNQLTKVNWLSLNFHSHLSNFNFEGNAIRHLNCWPAMLLPLTELNDVQPGTEDVNLLSPNETFSVPAKYLFLPQNPLQCDCCLSLMTYAIKKEGWNVIATCQVSAEVGRNIGAPEYLKHCYTKLVERQEKKILGEWI